MDGWMVDNIIDSRDQDVTGSGRGMNGQDCFNPYFRWWHGIWYIIIGRIRRRGRVDGWMVGLLVGLVLKVLMILVL